jgi:hypothetical protein
LRRAGPASIAAAGAAAAGLAVLGGCARADSALTGQQATVSFRPGTTPAMIAAVRAACSGLPGLRPASGPPVPGAAPVALRFDLNQPSGRDLARLQDCLMRFPLQVSGVSIKDTGGRG